MLAAAPCCCQIFGDLNGWRVNHALRAPPFFVHILCDVSLRLLDILQAAGDGAVQNAGGFDFFHFRRLHVHFADFASFAPNAVVVRAMRLAVLAAAAGLAAPDKLRADFTGQWLEIFQFFQIFFFNSKTWFQASMLLSEWGVFVWMFYTQKPVGVKTL